MLPLQTVTTYLDSWMVLFSAPEAYGPSYITGYYTLVAKILWTNDAGFITSGNGPRALYGQINDVYAYSNVNGSGTALYGKNDTHLIIAGTLKGKGMVAAVTMVSTTAAITAATKTTTVAVAPPTIVMAATATGVSYVSSTNIREIRSPAGGIMQFKGLTQTTDNDKYVEVTCRGVQPLLQGATAWRNIANTSPTTESNGFLISCMTGISQCMHSNVVSAVAY